MAETPQSILAFDLADCADCGKRITKLPQTLPDAGTDFPWDARDYDAMRLFMLEELVARFPDRRRWTPADMEVIIIEVFAALIDHLSDATDKAFAEGSLETARMPASVRRLLSFIGYDALSDLLAERKLEAELATASELNKQNAVERYWHDNPFSMEEARQTGVRTIFDQARMVTEQDFTKRLDDHPLVARANASSVWTGSWNTLSVAVILVDTMWRIDQSFDSLKKPANPAAKRAFERRLEQLQLKTEQFHLRNDLAVPVWNARPTFRSILRTYVDSHRMCGQDVDFRDAVPVGIAIVISIVVAPDFYQSEVRQAAEIALGDGEEGFFQAGNLKFGEDLFSSDIIAALMALDGVQNVCLIRFKRVGNDYPDQAEAGRITLNGIEIAVCDNISGSRERGYFHLYLNGGASR